VFFSVFLKKTVGGGGGGGGVNNPKTNPPPTKKKIQNKKPPHKKKKNKKKKTPKNIPPQKNKTPPPPPQTPQKPTKKTPTTFPRFCTLVTGEERGVKAFPFFFFSSSVQNFLRESLPRLCRRVSSAHIPPSFRPRLSNLPFPLLS